MGKNSTGAVTTSETTRIELSFLIKNGYLKKGCISNNRVSWTDGNSIMIQSVYIDEDIYIRLKYQITDYYTDEVTNFDYKIIIDEVPSNLGKGYLLYFRCPQTGRKCRILYQCYGSEIFKSRYAYKKRIYYDSQIGSKRSYHNDMYWRYENKILPELESRIKNSHYRGKPTKSQKNYEKAINKCDYYDSMRFGSLFQSLNLY